MTKMKKYLRMVFCIRNHEGSNKFSTTIHQLSHKTRIRAFHTRKKSFLMRERLNSVRIRHEKSSIENGPLP
jgi:hypothetical protein